MSAPYVLWFNQIDKEDIPLVGGKGANLGEMVKTGLPVPNGFVVTAQAYYYFIEHNKLQSKIRKILEGIDVEDSQKLQSKAKLVQELIIKAEMPQKLGNKIVEYYLKMKEPLVAVRSSATAEDLPTASFAGQQATFLNTKGESNVVDAVRRCYASLFEARAIYYRVQNKFDHFKVGIAVPVQTMVESYVSGIMFSLDPVTNDKTKIVIEAVYGLGENIVQGQTTPDHYEVDKSSLKILKKEIVIQKEMMTQKKKHDLVPKEIQTKRKLTDDEIIQLARYCKKLENHYLHPQDAEWAMDDKRKLYIVQTRPVTTAGENDAKNSQQYDEKVLEKELKEMKLILSGAPASPGIAVGPVRNIKTAKEIDKVKIGDILVAPETNPDFVPAMKRAAAIVTDFGGRTSHAAIVSRELGVPCIVGTEKATTTLKDHEIITVHGSEGNIYKGALISKAAINKDPRKIDFFKKVTKTATKVYVNLAEPEGAERISNMNIDGIGLLRAEFMLAQMKDHPRLVIKEHKEKKYIEQLANNLAVFCEHFNPRPVIYRATDFKTNEYRALRGGNQFEPQEENPLIGFRGCYRYIKDPEVFKLEIEAIKMVRNKMGYKNLWLMIPFVHTVKEIIEVKHLLSVNGLSRTPTFKLYMMVEIPSNVILLDDFIDAGIDGVSIGSNDLTMLILGLDRDNAEIAKQFDERNPAVLWALEKIIKTCVKRKISCGICGQAPSDYPELTEKLVEWGITSVSVNPDVIDITRQIVYDAERKLVQ